MLAFLTIGGSLNLQTNSYFQEIIHNVVSLHKSSQAWIRPVLRSLINNQSILNLRGFGTNLDREQDSGPTRNEQGQKAIRGFVMYNPEKKGTSKKELHKLIITTCISFSERLPSVFGGMIAGVYQEIADETDNSYSTSATYQLHLEKGHIYSFLKNSRPDICPSIAKFYRTIPPNFVPLKVRTDKCDLCHEGSILEAWLLQNKNKTQKDPKDVITLQALKRHRKIFAFQNAAFDFQTKNPDADTCVVVTEFKDNIVIGTGTDKSAGGTPVKAVFATLEFAVIYRSEQDDILTDFYYYISSTLNRTSRFSGECLVDFMKNPFMERFNNVVLWSDNGSQFRSFEYAHYLFVDVPSFFRGTITFNRFCEYHGSHFADEHCKTILQSVKQLIINKRDIGINDLKEILDQYEIKRQNSRNAAEPKDSESISSFVQTANNVYFNVYKMEGQTTETESVPSSKASKINKLSFKNSKECLSFHYRDGKLYGAPISHQDCRTYSEIKTTIKVARDCRKIRTSADPQVKSRKSLKPQFKVGKKVAATLDARAKRIKLINDQT